MKMLAGSECKSQFFIVLNSKLVKNTIYFLPAKSRAPYSRIPYITTQISEFALNIIFHSLMNIFELVLEWGGRKGRGKRWEQTLLHMSHFFSHEPSASINSLFIYNITNTYS